jgi:hypothetical protein
MAPIWPEQVGFYGGCRWGEILSGWMYIELELSEEGASQFFYSLTIFSSVPA